jgi:hypothetical protein
MATTLLIEEERGTCTGRIHPHNGYYAGDFSRTEHPGNSAAVPAQPGLLLASAAPLPGSTYAA